MSADFLIAQTVVWSVVIAVCVWVMRRSTTRFRARLGEFVRNEARWEVDFRRQLDEMDRRSEERAEVSRRKLDQMIAAADALANAPYAGDDEFDPPENHREVVIRVSLDAVTLPAEVQAVVGQLRVAVDGVRTPAGDRLPFQVVTLAADPV